MKIPNPVLQNIHDKDGFTSPAGEWIELIRSGGIFWPFAETLYDTVKKYKVKKALEIGMASGISSLSILSGLKENGDETRLVSIDPFQSTLGRGAGVNHVREAGLSNHHQLLEEFDYLALPKLVAAGEKFDFIYIDGNHDFEYVMLNFFYADLLVTKGSIIGFNDCGWKSVHAAMKHVPKPGDYTEIDVGLKPDYKGRNIVATVTRWCTGRSSSDRYFQKNQGSNANTP